MYAVTSVIIGPFLERANIFELPDWDEAKLLNMGFQKMNNDDYRYILKNGFVDVWVTEKAYGWTVCCSGMSFLLDWVKSAILQYTDTREKYGFSSWDSDGNG